MLPEIVQCNASNALEADNRIWRHETQTRATKILICSTDTDVYKIGLSTSLDKDYVIQLHTHHAVDKKYLILSNTYSWHFNETQTSTVYLETT